MFLNWKKLIFFVAIIYCVFAEVSELSDLKKDPREVYRLPTTVHPIHYDLEITPYFPQDTPTDHKENTFDGIVAITLRATKANVTEIFLHSKGIFILNTTLQSGNESYLIKTLIFNQLTEQVKIQLELPLKEERDYVLSLKFKGQINYARHGFYRSRYVENGVVKYLGTTQFQPTHAREAFPCFDEPSFKATFSLIINRPIHFRPSFSNTEILNSSLINDRYREIFAKTPKMSTYTLAFIISEFTMRETPDKRFGVICRPDVIQQTLYAFNVGQLLLKKFNNWTQYLYSSVPEMKKLHMAGLPDFSAGAMENWGLITYREVSLLYDPLISTNRAEQQVASVIAHEQAHMWFGNLVTCDWWSYLWLNEAFARYFQYFGLAMVEKKWELDLQFVLEELHYVFIVDANEYVKPMSFDVNTPQEINAKFDSITYNKGAVVLRMIEHIMGSSNFQAAIRAYIVANAYGTTTPHILYAALQEKTDRLNVARFLNSWTTQSGYPLITVKRNCDRRLVTVTQKRFLIKYSNHTDQTKWEIPLNYITQNNDKFTDTKSIHILGSEEDSITFQLDRETDWIIFNVLQTGYYRVNYDAETWENIVIALKANNHSGIHPINRAQIVDDSLNLVTAGYLDYVMVFKILKYLEKEEHYLPWTAATNNLAFITNRFNETVRTQYKKFFIKLSKGIYNKLGFDEKITDSRLDIYNRVNILNYNCEYGNIDCIQSAKDIFAKMRNKGTQVPVNLRPTVYCTAIEHGYYGEYYSLLQKYLYENVSSEKNLILNALGCASQKWILWKYMNFILTDDVRLQDKQAAFTATFNHRIENVPIVLDFIIRNHFRITATFGTINNLEMVITNLASRFTTQKEIDTLQQFYECHKHIFGASRAIPFSIDQAKQNLLWVDENIQELYKFLKAENIPVPSTSTKWTINILLICFISGFMLIKNI